MYFLWSELRLRSPASVPEVADEGCCIAIESVESVVLGKHEEADEVQSKQQDQKSGQPKAFAPRNQRRQHHHLIRCIRRSRRCTINGCIVHPVKAHVGIGYMKHQRIL